MNSVRVILAVAGVLGIANPALGAPLCAAYVTTDPISVIDTATNTVVGTIAPGGGDGIAISPNQTVAYMTIPSTPGFVVVIDTSTGAVTGTIAVGPNPIDVRFTPDGSRAYVANFATPGSVSVINTSSNTVSSTLSVATGPDGVAITPDGAFVYTTHEVFNPGSVSVISTATNTLTATIAVGPNPRGIALTPNGAFAYVTNTQGSSVSAISTALQGVIATIPVGQDPEDVAISPDGTLAYVANADSNSVSVISTASNTVGATVQVGTSPRGVAVTPDGRLLYVVNTCGVSCSSPAGTVSVIDTTTNTVITTIPVGSTPVRVAIASIQNGCSPLLPTATPTPPAPLSGSIRYYSNAAPVSGATVQLAVGATVSAQTDSTGQYAFPGIATPGYYTVSPSKYGDQGNGISVLDAVYILQAIAGLRLLTPAQRLAADVTGDGSVSTLDAVRILQLKAGLLTRFAVAQTCGSDWAFIPVPTPAPNETIAMPQMATGVCQAGSIAFEPLTGTAGDQDFSAVLFGDVTGNWQPPLPTP